MRNSNNYWHGRYKHSRYLHVTYSADASGNQATATRTVNVVDTTDPVITVLGNNPETVELAQHTVRAGATSDGGETVTTTGTVNANTIGTYTITYTVTDASGNQATATRTVNVVDTSSSHPTSRFRYCLLRGQLCLHLDAGVRRSTIMTEISVQALLHQIMSILIQLELMW